MFFLLITDVNIDVHVKTTHMYQNNVKTNIHLLCRWSFFQFPFVLKYCKIILLIHSSNVGMIQALLIFLLIFLGRSHEKLHLLQI